MALLFFQIDLNKLRHDLQKEVTLIYAKFGEDLCNISTVVGYKTKWPFFGLPCIIHCVSKNAPTLKRYSSKY